jgi:small subunit ribosomal protein S3
MQNRDVKGAKILMKGRLDGNEIARNEHLSKGSLPLQTLRADIDYGTATAFTTYGTIGIRVWIYKGEVFAKTAKQEEEESNRARSSSRRGEPSPSSSNY